jgi:hypothetical protein
MARQDFGRFYSEGREEKDMDEEQDIEAKETGIVNTLNAISNIKRQAMEEESHFYVAKIICDCENLIKELHGENCFYRRENKAVTDQLRNHFAALAMSALLTTYTDEGDVVEEAYSIADNMVKYGQEEKQEGEVEGTEDGLDDADTEDNN